jgi:hypothetical protein
MKKNLLLSLAIIFLFSIGAWAQGTTSLTVTIESGEYVEGAIDVPVRLVFDDPSVGVGSFDLIVDIDDLTVLSIQGATLGSGVPTGLTPPIVGSNPFTVSYASTTSVTNTTLTDDLLLTLQFNALMPGTSSLTFNFVGTTTTEFYENDNSTGPISTTYVNGFITITSAVPLSMWAFFLMAGLIVAFLAFRVVRLF